nr:winged helix-turn-helix domain-containing protein [Candidatus Paracaedibacter symbiosus]
MCIIQNSDKSTAAILNIYNYLQHHPIATTTKIKQACSLSLPTIMRSLTSLEKMGIIKEITGKERHKIFVYKEYLDILNQGTSFPHSN